MTDQADPHDKAIRVLLEALTTISYLKGGDGRASAIAEYALDRYGKLIRETAGADQLRSAPAGSPQIKDPPAARPGLPGRFSQRNPGPCRRRNDRRHVNCGPPSGLAERRAIGDRRLNSCGR